MSRSLVVQAIIAGIIGGIIVDAFLSIELHVSPLALETHNAAIATGPGASPVLGVIIHFVTAVVWAVIYAYVFNAAGKLQNWVAGAIVLGVVVSSVMNLIITMKTGASWSKGFALELIPNVVFYALPVALYLARTVRRA
ncbi:MAG TPA: hypothetical protein VFE36_05975 [Candidatus Baltobacteraceae bacterium]|nr:hypothetical protein [Candidatus Baltobacteraceae bacterium]